MNLRAYWYVLSAGACESYARWIFPYDSLDSWELLKYARRGELDTSKARTLLGYTPRFSLQEGMRETEAWLRDQRII